MITVRSARLSKCDFGAPMGAKATGSVFWAFYLVLFPVTVPLSSHGCVSYKHIETCGLEGSSVEFPCSYPKNVQVIFISGWSKILHHKMKPKPLKHLQTYSLRMNYLGRENNDCTIILNDLQKKDTSIYYFVYRFTTVTGYHMTCKGSPGVRLNVFASPVHILVENLVMEQDVLVADWTVKAGERLRLTCVPNCAANLNFNLGYIWYKNRLQLMNSRGNSPFLYLDPISKNDTGSYVCAMIGYKNFPSSAVKLRVQESPRNTVSGGGSKKDSVPTLTYDCDTLNSTDQIFNNCHTPRNKIVFTFSIIIVVSVCVGWVIAMVTILVLKVQKMKSRGCVGSVPRPSDPSGDSYMTLDINSMSAEYDKVRYCSAADTVYENLHQPENSTR